MRAAVIPSLNGIWEVQDVPIPEVGPGQVLIKVHASGICYSDIWATQGMAGVQFPWVTGHEPAGEVIAVGKGVTTRKVGDRVGTTWMQATCGRCDYCSKHYPISGQAAINCAAPVMTGFTIPGGHAQYLLASADTTVFLPEGLSYEEAAPILCAGYTAWCGLRLADPQPHERIAVLGIGGLGHLAIQYAKAAGFETIAITHSPDKHALARRLGADLVVSSGEQLKAVGGADVILNTSNSYRAGGEAMQGLHPEGRLMLIGIGTDKLEIDASGWIYGQRHRIIGSTHNGLQYLNEALEIAASGKVRPMIETYPLDKAAEAYSNLVAGKVRFKAVLLND